MKRLHILVLGAGRSSGSLIQYLADWSTTMGHAITVADRSPEALESKCAEYPSIQTVTLDDQHLTSLESLVKTCDIVVSLLPPEMHVTVGQMCLHHGKHMATASYATPEIMAMDKEAKEKNLVFLYELGVDPGIDHMSSLHMIHKAMKEKGKIQSFKSFGGALLSPETEKDNPWNYKFTWNPRNVVLNGQGSMARYRIQHRDYYVPYARLFRETWNVHVPDAGDYEAYANRNSLQYIQHYGLKDVPTLIRGTLRRPGFCEAWNALIHWGATHNDTVITVENDVPVKDYFSHLMLNPSGLDHQSGFEQQIGFALSDEAWKRISFLELNGHLLLPKGSYTPAEVLLHVLLQKWALHEQDKDMVVMYHELTYHTGQTEKKIVSTLCLKGKNSRETAISSTVGLPLAMGVRLIAEQKIPYCGVILPVVPEIFIPILEELRSYGISFTTHTT
jgi:saccharopine dehydrogenase-like NADP-dependent oxidoreductase